MEIEDLVKSFQTLLLRSFVQIFIFQSLSTSLFLNFFSNEIAIQTSIYYLLANIGVDTDENGPLNVRQHKN